MVLKQYDKVILDLSGINYVSSTGIGSFTRLIKVVKPKGGDIVFINTVSKVLDVFQLLGFTSFFIFLDDLSSAVEFLENKKQNPYFLFLFNALLVVKN